MTTFSTNANALRRTVGLVLAASGALLLFAYFIKLAGVGEVFEGIARLGWVFLIVVVLGGIRFLVRAAAWIRCLDGNHRLRLSDVFQAVIAGDALGNLTPLNVIVSEPAKAMFLQHREPMVRTLPALAIEDLFYTLSAMLVIIGGLVAVPLVLRPPGELWFAISILFVSLVALVIAAHWLIWNHVPVGSTVATWLQRRGIAPTLMARMTSRIQTLENHIHALYPREWSRLLPVAALESLFHVLAVLEIFLVLSATSELQPTLLDAFVFESTNRLIAVVFKFVPLRIGVDEAGTGMFADLLAFGTTSGVTLAIIRKGRMLVWVALGLATLIGRGLSVRRSLAAATSKVVLVVMARSPEGKTPPKTRLEDAVTNRADRQRLYKAFLEDTINACRTVPGTTLRVAHTNDGSTEWLEELGVATHEAFPQRGDDLGARECQVFTDLFAEGFEKIVMIGSDLPTLPMKHISQAINEIADDTVVLGPSEDGGYYLMALPAPASGSPVPDLFTNIQWSTSSTFNETCAAADREGLHISLTPQWYDVDDSVGLRRLQVELTTDVGQTRAPATTRVLKGVGGQETK
jgi:rSAM/selenodomain-associated transferase 1